MGCDTLTVCTRFLGQLPERWKRRALRRAVRSRDVTKVKSLVDRGCDVNGIVSDVYQDTALTWSVKQGYLEIVEVLLQVPGCSLDHRDRNKHSALDEAIRAWLSATGTRSTPSTPVPADSKQPPKRPAVTGSCKSTHRHRSTSTRSTNNNSINNGKLTFGSRYHILKSLLEAGARQVSITHLDMIVYRTLSVPAGPALLDKLAKLIAETGNQAAQSVLLSVLVSYNLTHDSIKYLLEAGADPVSYLTKEPARPFMPFMNAMLLLKASNDAGLLKRVECDTTGQLQLVGEAQWGQLQHVLRLLVVCAHPLQLYVLSYLRDHQPDFYLWVLRQDQHGPRTLKSLARVTIRRHLQPNVLCSTPKLTSLPEGLQNYLLLSEWLVARQRSDTTNKSNIRSNQLTLQHL